MMEFLQQERIKIWIAHIFSVADEILAHQNDSQDTKNEIVNLYNQHYLLLWLLCFQQPLIMCRDEVWHICENEQINFCCVHHILLFPRVEHNTNISPFVLRNLLE